MGYEVAKSSGRMSKPGVKQAAEIRNLSIMVMSLIAAFIVCWGPAQVIELSKATGRFLKVCPLTCKVVMLVKKFLIWTSAVVNSLIYLSMVGCRKRRRKQESNGSQGLTKTSRLVTPRETVAGESLVPNETFFQQ